MHDFLKGGRGMPVPDPVQDRRPPVLHSLNRARPRADVTTESLRKGLTIEFIHVEDYAHGVRDLVVEVLLEAADPARLVRHDEALTTKNSASPVRHHHRASFALRSMTTARMTRGD